MLRHIVSNEIFTILITVGLITIAMAKLVSPKRFNDFILVLAHDKYLKIYSKERRFFDAFGSLLFINLTLSVSVFCYIAYQQIMDSPGVVLNIIFKIGLGVSIFTLAKMYTERLVGNIFEINQLLDEYIFQKISFKNYLGLLLVPINAFLIYSYKPTITTIISITSILLIINVISLISSFKTHQTLIKNNLFYFILYLCILEFAPYIFLYKVFI